jgi:Endosomal/lysosomal potassium channel TMEM175
MGKGRLEAFTDGVMAIIITIMVLEIKVPPGTDLAAFSSSLPILFTYALSFLNVGIFWNNHHHMLHAATHVDGQVLWANRSRQYIDIGCANRSVCNGELLSIGESITRLSTSWKHRCGKCGHEDWADATYPRVACPMASMGR